MTYIEKQLDPRESNCLSRDVRTALCNAFWWLDPIFSRLPNARMLNIWLDIKKQLLYEENKKSGECHATTYGFLRLWYKYELRKYSH